LSSLHLQLYEKVRSLTSPVEVANGHGLAMPVLSEISDFTPCVHAQSTILYIKYAEKTDD